MKSRILTAGLGAGLVLAGAAACAQTYQSEPRYGVCAQQITDFVQQQIGHTPTRIDFKSYSERTPPRSLLDPGSALVYVKECSGFHVFEVRGTMDLCEHIPHYGTSSGSYVRYEGAYEGCKKG